MGYFYIFTIVLLGFTFICSKKSEKELNLIKWICIFLVGVFAYNITICMILGILNIKQSILLLSIINILLSIIPLYKLIKKHESQKYKTSRLDIFMIIVILIIFGVMFVKDLYIYKGNVTHVAIDSAVHYRAAKHYSENLELFIYTDDKTFFDFNIMQTGAYINDGIFMNVVHDITGLEKVYIYQIFECLTLFVGALGFYAAFADKIKTKRGAVLSLMLFGLYLYGYPYNSWIYGFSYLSVGIGMTAFLLTVVEMLFNEDTINKKFIIILISCGAMGLMFSYCMFVPALFASICIFVFIKELKDKTSKKYLKIFGKNTLIITGILLLITAFGIGYLFIPSFTIEGQMDLVSALKEEGGIYPEKYFDFLPYIPFAILYAVNFIIRVFKEKDIRYLDVFSICIVGLLVVFYLGLLTGKVSLYYMLKMYFIFWMVIFAITIDLVNEYIDKKILKWIIPLYVLVWTSFVIIWVWVKAGHILGEEEKHALPNYVGIYYIENCEHRKAYDMLYSFSEDNIEITKYARENLNDLTADNAILMTESFYRQMWGMATLEFSSDHINFRDVLNAANQYNVKDTLANPNIKYIIRLDSDDQTKKEECITWQEELNESGITEILISNEHGFVAKINR